MGVGVDLLEDANMACGRQRWRGGGRVFKVGRGEEWRSVPRRLGLYTVTRARDSGEHAWSTGSLFGRGFACFFIFKQGASKKSVSAIALFARLICDVVEIPLSIELCQVPRYGELNAILTHL